VLSAREFLDPQTSEAHVIAIFYSPDSGDITVVQISSQFHGSAIAVWGLGIRVWSSGGRGLGSRVWELEFRVEGGGWRVG